jgi:vancomycin permeability regulator SanA
MLKFLKILWKLGLAFFAVLIAFFLFTGAYLLSFYGEEATEKADCAVVFGAAVWPGGKASDSLDDRIQKAIELYKDGKVRCLILSGANSVFGKHEAELMYEIAKNNGVKKDALQLDFEGYNTCYTIRNLGKNKSYIFVSNDFHLARINYFARRFQLEDYQLQASDYMHGPYLKGTYFFTREIMALWYYLINFNGACKNIFSFYDIKAGNLLNSLVK